MKTSKRILALLLVAIMLLGVVGCGKTEKPADSGEKDKPAATGEINAVEYGCDNTGATDCTQLMMKMHKEGAEKNQVIYYPNGTYLFNGATLDFSSGVRFESQDKVLIRNKISEEPIVNFDDNGNLIGLMQNHLEQRVTGGDIYMVTGNLVSPPLSEANYETTVDFLPYWYNDFGLQVTYGGKGGSKTWFDWSWNHHACQTYNPTGDPYDPALHPLLGWYRGDEVNTLDWICYWLKEYGINQTAIYTASKIDTTTWDNPINSNYWIYQLWNNTPNGALMKYVVYVRSHSYKTNEAELRGEWDATLAAFFFNEQLKSKDMVYYMNVGGKKYPVLVLWDEKSIAYSFGQDKSQLLAYYKQTADQFKSHGYEGVAILARTPALSDSPDLIAELAKSDVIWRACAYPCNGVSSSPTYPELVNSFMPITNKNVLYGVATGKDSHTPHPSEWSCPGTNPADFGKWIKNAIADIDKNKDRDRIVTCYNISEWAEGGPGLVPTVKDRFAYLEAIRDAVVKK